MLDGSPVEPDIELTDRIHPGFPGTRRSGTGTCGRDSEGSEVATSETVPVSEKPACRPLNIGESWLRGEISELLTGVQHKFQLRKEWISMEPNTPVEIHQVTVNVIEHLNL
jgi:hypothetical protein